MTSQSQAEWMKTVVEEAFDSFEIGYAASVAVVMTLVILLITSLQLIASRLWVRY